jgi:protocatechuate 3,4-dioxygenase beta subunit
VDSEGRVAATVAASGLTEQVVTLEPQPRIEGTVTDEAGTPLAGALVAAEPRRPSRPRPYLDALHTRGRTDARGCFRIPGLAPGTYQLLVFDAAGQRPWSGAAEDGFEPRDIDLSADLVTVDLIVASGARRVRGRVVDVAGDPVEDARVVVSATGALLPPSGHAGRPVLTDRRGRFEVAGVFGEELEIAATGPRGKRQAAPLNVTGDDPVELIVAPLSTLRAAVIDGDEPVEGFELRVGRGPSSVLGERVAQERGGFEIPRLIAGDYEIEIRAGDRYASEIVTVGPGPVTSVSFELQPMASVRGRLLDADGAPVSGAVVSAIGLTLALDRGGKAAGGSRPRTGADGSFAIRGLIAGRGYLTFTRSPRGFDLIGMAAIELAPGQDLDLGAVRGGGLMTPSIPSRDHSPDLGLRFWLGSGPPTPAELARADGAPPRPPAPPGSRLWIAAVKEDSPAHRAGFQAGDRVVAVGQRRIGDGAAALEAMASLTQRWRSRGRSVEWVIQRHGQERRVPVLVPER